MTPYHRAHESNRTEKMQEQQDKTSSNYSMCILLEWCPGTMIQHMKWRYCIYLGDFPEAGEDFGEGHVIRVVRQHAHEQLVLAVHGCGTPIGPCNKKISPTDDGIRSRTEQGTRTIQRKTAVTALG